MNPIEKSPLAMLPADERATAKVLFEQCMAARNRMLITLGTVFFTYYFTFIIGAGWFRNIYTFSLVGGLNVGTFFALSQYFFVAGLALIYAYRMKRIDADVKAFTDTWRATHENG